MKVTAFTAQALAYRRDQRDHLKDDWEFVDLDGGRLWELSRGYRYRQRIVEVAIAEGGKGLWVKCREEGSDDPR